MFTPRLQSILGHTVTVISKGFDSDGDTSASPYAGECLDTGERLEELLLQQPLDSIVITGLNVADFAAETGLFFDTPTTILTDLCRWRVRNTARPARRDASPAIRGHADMKRSTEWLKTTR
jgi:hypothetical protein